MPHAAAVTEVKYLLTDTQSLHGCPCMRRTSEINSNKHTTYVSYSAVNITVMAKNAAGFSPPEIIQVSAKPDVDLKGMCVCASVCYISCLLILKSTLSTLFPPWQLVTNWYWMIKH